MKLRKLLPISTCTSLSILAMMTNAHCEESKAAAGAFADDAAFMKKHTEPSGD